MRRALRVGVPAGIIAGVVMAVWSMIAMWLTGSGAWTPLNLVAHTFYRSAPLNNTFSAPALAIGLAIHMTMAIIFGTAITALAQRLPGKRSLVIAGGILFVAVVWPIMQYGVWYSIDQTAAEGFTGWIFAIAHLIFGLVAASVAAIGVDDEETGMRRRHGMSTSQPGPTPSTVFQPGHRRTS
jgi:hypothetical protein